MTEIQECVREALRYAGTDEGKNVLLVLLTFFSTGLLQLVGVPVTKNVVRRVKSLFTTAPSELLADILKELDDPNALLNERTPAQSHLFDEFITEKLAVRYSKGETCPSKMIDCIMRGNENLFRPLTQAEKKAVGKRLLKAITFVKDRDWNRERAEALANLRKDVRPYNPKV